MDLLLSNERDALNKIYYTETFFENIQAAKSIDDLLDSSIDYLEQAQVYQSKGDIERFCERMYYDLKNIPFDE